MIHPAIVSNMDVGCLRRRIGSSDRALCFSVAADAIDSHVEQSCMTHAFDVHTLLQSAAAYCMYTLCFTKQEPTQFHRSKVVDVQGRLAKGGRGGGGVRILERWCHH
jgi:hypothetical protein